MADHHFAAVQRLWQEMRGEFEEAATDSALAEEAAVASEELKKVAKWIQHGVTKFGASAAVAEGEMSQGLKPIAEEVIKAFTAAIGTLLSIKRGAGTSLLAELKTTGANLAAALDEFGKSVGKPDMPTCAGKVLDRVKTLERTSTHNRAAIRRRLLSSLSQLRDAHRELQEALTSGGDGDEDEDDDDDDFFEGLDTKLEPEERLLVESLAELASTLVEMLKKVSTASMPSKEGNAVPVSITELEVAVGHAPVAASAMDNLAVASNGGLDPDEFSKGLAEMRGAVSGLLSCPVASNDAALSKAIAAVSAAFDAAVAAELETAQNEEPMSQKPTGGY